MEKKLLPKIIDLLLDTVCAVDEDGKIVYASASCEDLLGYSQEELFDRNIIELVHPDDRDRTLAAAEDIKNGWPCVHFENRYIHKGGHIVDIMWSARWSKDDRLRLAVARDMTPVKQAERLQTAIFRISEAGQTAEDLPILCELIHDIINDLLPLRNFSVVLYNQETKAISIPYCVGELACMGNSTSPHPPTLLSENPRLTRVIISGELVLTTSPTNPDPGQQSSERQWLGVPLSAGRKVIGAIIAQGGVNTPNFSQKDQDFLQFISTQIAAAIERKQTETRLTHMAGHDPLTDLPNRILFQNRVGVALNQAQHDNQQFALLYLDLDNFKQVNDQFGHEVGDQLLIEVTNRLVACLRKSDTAGRMGGDEFTVLLANTHDQNCVSRMIQKIRKAFERPFEILTHRLTISASIGSASYPNHGHEYNQLLRHADQKMYVDKKKNKRPTIAPSFL